MDQNQPELTFEESMKQVMKTLPPLIRDYLVQGKYTPIARSLMTKYALRIDQGGVLEREIMLLLMGVESPTEFTEALAEEAKLTKLVIDGIVQDVNNLIFMPLRTEEEKSGMGASAQAPVKPMVPTVPSRPIAPVVTAPRSAVASGVEAPRPTVVATSRPVVVAAPHIAPLPPKTVMPISSAATLGDVMRSILPTPVPELKTVKSINLLADHEEPSPSLKATQAIAPVAVTEPVMPKAPAVPPAPVNLPGAMPPYTIPTKVIPGLRPTEVVAPQIPAVESLPEPMLPKPVFAPSLPPKPIAPVVAPAPIAPYSSDPYREPVDEPIDEM